MPINVYIYTLSEEGNSDVRYVGQTAHPDARLISHYNVDNLTSTNSKRVWIEDLISRNGRLVMAIVDECDVNEATIREQEWIDYYSAEGCVLTNSIKANPSRLYYGNEPAKKPTNFRISPRTIEMMDEICQSEGINGRAALVQKLIDDYAKHGTIAERIAKCKQRIADHERRIKALEGSS